MAGHLKKQDQAACLSQAQEIYRAETYRAARKAWLDWAATWSEVAPGAAQCLGRDLEKLLTFLKVPDIPRRHHRSVRTTNYIERVIRELRRRTRPMGAFAHRSSCDRLFYGVVQRLNRNWSRKPLAAFTQKS